MSNKSIPSPFDSTVHKTERSAVSIMVHWMRNIINENNIDLGPPDVETVDKKRKMPDTVIYRTKRSKKVLCVIEAKQPYYAVFNEALKEDALRKANRNKAEYFVTTNFRQFIWWKTKKANDPTLTEEQQIIEKFPLSEIENLDDIEQVRYKEPIKRALNDFLSKLYKVYTGIEQAPKLAIDEFLIFRLQEKIRVLSKYYKTIIEEQCHKDSSFARKLKIWFVDQGWSFGWQAVDFDRAARQTAYLLINKILFYDLLQAKRPNELDILEIPDSLTKGKRLRKWLQDYFDEVLEIDYETIYTADFIDSLAFPEAIEVVSEIKELINTLKRYDFSKLGYDIIGGIFERLIPPVERHNLGQYFTRSDIVDLILRFCFNHEDDKILDPSCGAGTFLVRAYQHKKLMNQRLGHEKILDSLWGNDIAKFPAHLATINLAINDLSVDKNYPNILHEDFFALLVGDGGFDPENWRKSRAKTPGAKEREIIYPRWFDAVVGNPPYTRQEEIGEIAPKVAEYKRNLISNALLFNGKRMANIGKRAGIHAYFFVHGTKFLKNGGYFGFIVSNSWLDVDYGKGLQEFFLKNYEIITIIDSKVERWFEDADINTCIVILRKCKSKKKRDCNIVRFAYLKKPLRDFIPPAEDMWEKQIDRKNALDALKNTILAHSELYENEDLRIFPKEQKHLWDEGFDDETNKYEGSKWGKYLRAPEIFFKILKKGKDLFVPLKEIAELRRGFTTGANTFFYLTEDEIKKRKIEKDYWMHKDTNGEWVPNKVIVSPRESKSVIFDPNLLDKILISIDKEKKDLKKSRILSYIQRGESQGFNERKTCKSRKLWYRITLRNQGQILFPMIHNDRQSVFFNKFNVQVDHNLFELKPKTKKNTLPLLYFLLSTISMLMKEFYGRVNLGQGALKTEGIDIQKFPVPKTFTAKQRSSFLKFAINNRNFSLNSIFDDIGTKNPNDIKLESIAKARRELDQLVMGEILGMNDEEQLEVYKAVVDVVKTRLEKAKSVKKANTIGGIDIELLKQSVVTRIDNDSLQ